ncbi:MAG: hypothetical protein NC102_05130 [Clostridium sp.]|nr:hypothetical protein [Clostridium sp.]
MKIKSLFASILAVAALSMASCSGKQAQAEAEAEGPVVFTVDEVVAQAPELTDSVITIEGVCSHTCKHGATKMFLIGDSTTLRVEAGELGSFDTKVINNLVNVNGKVCETRIDEAYLSQLEEQIKANMAEKHGETEAGCSHDNAANNVTATTPLDQVAEMRAQIAERTEKEGKPYLSRYYVLANSYEIVEQ